MSVLQTVAETAFTVTKSDSTDITGTRAVYVGTAGALHVRNMQGNTVIFANVPNATLIITGAIDRVMNATTAADMVGILTQ
jgi:hypothetical protein